MNFNTYTVWIRQESRTAHHVPKWYTFQSQAEIHNTLFTSSITIFVFYCALVGHFFCSSILIPYFSFPSFIRVCERSVVNSFPNSHCKVKVYKRIHRKTYSNRLVSVAHAMASIRARIAVNVCEFHFNSNDE